MIDILKRLAALVLLAFYIYCMDMVIIALIYPTREWTPAAHISFWLVMISAVINAIMSRRWLRCMLMGAVGYALAVVVTVVFVIIYVVASISMTLSSMGFLFFALGVALFIIMMVRGSDSFKKQKAASNRSKLDGDYGDGGSTTDSDDSRQYDGNYDDYGDYSSSADEFSTSADHSPAADNTMCSNDYGDSANDYSNYAQDNDDTPWGNDGDSDTPIGQDGDYDTSSWGNDGDADTPIDRDGDGDVDDDDDRDR